MVEISTVVLAQLLVASVIGGAVMVQIVGMVQAGGDDD